MAIAASQYKVPFGSSIHLGAKRHIKFIELIITEKSLDLYTKLLGQFFMTGQEAAASE